MMELMTQYEPEDLQLHGEEIMNDLESAVIELHNIARKVEQEVGVGQLSEDIRKCADRLHELTKVSL
jgi:hypothetical protein